jgi:predicted SprT family Zn-dependent metalloprotease
MGKTKQQKKALAALNYDLFRLADHCPPAPATIYSKIQQHVQRQQAPVPIEAIKFTPIELPDVDRLYRMFDIYNWTYFKGKLPKVSIEFSNRMTSAGSYLPERKLIRIGRKYHEIFPDEIGDTLKHEMIHIRHLKHNSAFRAEAGRVGASLKAKSHPSLRKPPRYVYVCRSCGRQYPRQRRLRMASCGNCSSGNRFDPRFKLKLLRSARHTTR